MEFTILSGSSVSEFIVHRKGCRDIARTIKREFPFVYSYEVEGESAEAVVALEVADYQAQDQGWSFGDFLIEPCCKH